LPEHPFAERHDKGNFLGKRNELRWSHYSAPAQQSLEAGNLPGLKDDERLVKELKFARFECVAQIAFQCVAGTKVGVHAGFEETELAPSVDGDHTVPMKWMRSWSTVCATLAPRTVAQKPHTLEPPETGAGGQAATWARAARRRRPFRPRA
jgi:hypothetical protein